MKTLKLNTNIDTKGTQSDFCGGIMHAVHLFYFSIHKHVEHVLSLRGTISFSQFIILVGFSNQEASHMTQAKLAEHLMLTEATVSRHITTLVTKKLLTKVKDIANKKSYRLSLTPLGSKVYTDTKNIITNELDIYLSTISESHKKIIITNLTKITTLLNQKR
mgnify:CR=1 FL=1